MLYQHIVESIKIFRTRNKQWQFRIEKDSTKGYVDLIMNIVNKSTRGLFYPSESYHFVYLKLLSICKIHNEEIWCVVRKVTSIIYTTEL